MVVSSIDNVLIADSELTYDDILEVRLVFHKITTISKRIDTIFGGEHLVKIINLQVNLKTRSNVF